MTLPKILCLPVMLLVATSSCTVAHAAGTTTPDFSGIWRLDDQHSDSPFDIAARLRAEKKLEQPTPPATNTGSTGSPASQASTNRHSGHGGGGRSMGGGRGHDGGRAHDKSSDADASVPATEIPPPLLADDSMLNVQQDAKTIRVVFDDKDQLDGRLDGVVSQSLSGNAMVQSHLTAAGLDVSMQFDGEVRLQQTWTASPDGHHLTVTESWTTPAVKQPIVFKRSYDRLDI
ncbi:MAG TPA: hypothetical protein VGC19_04560 [Rhodanobacter sp.]